MGTESTIKQHDTKPIFKDVLMLNGSPIPLPGTTVKFILRQLYEDDPKIVSKSVPIENISQAMPPDEGVGAITYKPVAEDVDTAGVFRQEWEITFTDGNDPLTVPNGDYNLVRIIPDLG